MKLRKVNRDLYLASRAVGDLNAAEKGRLPQRLIKRRYHRAVIRFLRKGRLW